MAVLKAFGIAAVVAAATVGQELMGYSCTYISPDCLIRPPIEAECRSSPFNQCFKAPSSLVDYYYTTWFDGQTLTYQRYLDTECKVEDPDWRVTGEVGSCMGPVDERMGLTVYIQIELAHGAITGDFAYGTTSGTAGTADWMTTMADTVNTAGMTAVADIMTMADFAADAASEVVEGISQPTQALEQVEQVLPPGRR